MALCPMRPHLDPETGRLCAGGLPEMQEPVLESPATPLVWIYGDARDGVKPKATKVVQN
jgi:hypothetical protein